MMKNKLLLLLALLMTAATGAWAEIVNPVQIDGLYYNLDADNKTAVVTYKSYAEYSFNAGWDITTANIPASVEYNSVTYSVTSIGQNAFHNCTALTSVTIPNSVTSIGNQAFDHCESLTSVTIGNSVTSIGTSAFESCSGLTSITIPNSVTSIGNTAFNWCSGLTSITIPNSVTSIGNYAFYQCTGLTSVTIGSGVTSIGNSAFYNCTNTTDVYCYPNAADLTWSNGKNDFKASKATVCHVHADQLSAYQDKFTSTVRVTFVGDAPTTYTVSLKSGTEDASNWTITPTEATTIGVAENTEVTLQYNGRLKVKGVKATSDAAPTGNIVDLSTLTADYEAKDGDVLTGETTSYEVTIAAGATVTLDGVTISGSSYCIKCAGDATIILKDGSTNTLTNTGGDYPALSIGDANTTLTIQGSTGVLNVTSGEYCAGIGGGYANTNSTCGNIRIEGGVITAQGGNAGAGIGTDCGGANCGDIIITGGTITAKGGSDAAGIGTGSGISQQVVCGDITIANTVTKVTATKGGNAPHSIGKGYGDATCGTITIGGTKYWENNAAVGDGATYLATSPLEYQPSN